ncbi:MULTISPECIES: hypothetical protein [Halomonadaceae]|uniref:Nucleotide modification associated domain-containing protein n=1 Tax=Vreelandella piezotolerans TaxID=2609667 RepID=A0ABQ6X5Z9_9GAMM|nr:hypothetical protein [Halomonas piezotolerans]KAE8437445.1 hypothetical protein F1978_14830 [Halomonas piezotolerans]QJA24822.1 hypothetical protein GYM47_12315 [Halomonas piezotolerans]
MLIEPNSRLFTYVIARDFGFAPNPFHGICTLATCKPGIRRSACVGDWILGVAGKRLGSVHKKCILLMKVTEKISFQEYWEDERFLLKKPCRNGSNVMMLGDNIYHQDIEGKWVQEDSHHSNPDGSLNIENLERDTGTSDKVLISNFFFYFGSQAIPVNLASINYKSGVGFKKTEISQSNEGRKLIERVYEHYFNDLNSVVSDPCQFIDSQKRVNQKLGKIY